MEKRFMVDELVNIALVNIALQNSIPRGHLFDLVHL